VKGRELAVGVRDARAMGAIEIEPKGVFYDFQSKYAAGRSEYRFPARLAPTRYKGVLNIAERAVHALGVTGACRVDLLVTEGENEYVLEVNTLPGLTPTSLLPKIAHGAGLDFGDLCEAVVARPVRPAQPRRRDSGVAPRPVTGVEALPPSARTASP